MDKQELIDLIVSCGADHAAFLPGSAVVTNPEYRKICEGNACGRFGRCHMCPPDIGEVDDLINRVKQYSSAILYQTIGHLEDSFDFEGMMEAGREHSLCSQRIRRQLQERLPGHLHLSGGCRLCERCAKLDQAPCRYPGEALPPVEGYGIDVYQTSQATNLKYINGQDTVTYFGIILYSE